MYKYVLNYSSNSKIWIEICVRNYCVLHGCASRFKIIGTHQLQKSIPHGLIFNKQYLKSCSKIYSSILASCLRSLQSIHCNGCRSIYRRFIAQKVFILKGFNFEGLLFRKVLILKSCYNFEKFLYRKGCYSEIRNNNSFGQKKKSSK